MVEVRTITDGERDAFFRAMARGFHFNASDDETRRFAERLDPARTHGAFDGDEMVGTARVFPTELTVPGARTIPAAAVTNVTVASTHRRQGLLTEMMRQELADIASRAEPVAILIASEAAIYGRFGYGVATEHVLLEIDAVNASFRAPAPPGSVRLASPEQMRETAPAVYDQLRRAQPGAIGRDDRYWDVTFGVVPAFGTPEKGQQFGVVRRDADGAIDGYAQYRITADWDYRIPAGVLELDDLVALTDDAYHALWRHCIEVDWITRVRAENRPPVEPLPQLLIDPRVVRQRERADLMWLRIVDVAAALSARTYRVADRLVLDVVDEFFDHGGRFVLETTTDAARCAPTSDAADLTLAVADLGAAYLGGTALWPAAAAGRVRAHTAGAVERFDRLFLTDRAPWCHTWF
ncbi:MAG TPA: GNAT family N-acetyltransferase [Acidimicrobiia bacterium]|nr:GNAT family N-acetyltransferase [Acidimicrobiia bacterium]